MKGEITYLISKGITNVQEQDDIILRFAHWAGYQWKKRTPRARSIRLHLFIQKNFHRFGSFVGIELLNRKKNANSNSLPIIDHTGPVVHSDDLEEENRRRSLALPQLPKD